MTVSVCDCVCDVVLAGSEEKCVVVKDSDLSLLDVACFVVDSIRANDIFGFFRLFTECDLQTLVQILINILRCYGSRLGDECCVGVCVCDCDCDCDC